MTCINKQTVKQQNTSQLHSIILKPGKSHGILKIKSECRNFPSLTLLEFQASDCSWRCRLYVTGSGTPLDPSFSLLFLHRCRSFPILYIVLACTVFFLPHLYILYTPMLSLKKFTADIKRAKWRGKNMINKSYTIITQ